jgi:hypothetical protein
VELDEKRAKALLGLMHEINQDMKTIPGLPGTWQLSGARAEAGDRKQLFSAKIEAVQGEGKKFEAAADLLEASSGRPLIVETEELFAFVRDFKQKVVAAKREDSGSLSFETSIPGVSLAVRTGSSPRCYPTELDEVASGIPFPEEVLAEFSAFREAPGVLCVNLEGSGVTLREPMDESFVRLVLHPKFLFRVEAGAEVTTSVFLTGGEGIFLIEITMSGRKLRKSQTFAVVDY